MFDFPASPTAGQVFSPVGGPTYTWNGVAWAANLPPSATADTRNRIINGNGQISEELGSGGTSVNNAYFCDQWQYGVVGPTVGAFRSMSYASPNGSLSRMNLNVTVAQPSLVANSVLHLYQQIEGLRIADLIFGAANCKPVVLRFVVNAPIAGTYCVSVRNNAGTRSWLGSFTVTAPNVDQQFSLAIPGDVTGTWAKDNTCGMLLSFCFAAGTNYIGVPGWQAANVLAVPGITNGVAITGQIMVTDVGLYADPLGTGLAPRWEPMSYEDDLFDCQRYWQKCQDAFFSGNVTNAQTYYVGGKYIVPPRISPALSGVVASASNFAAVVGTLGDLVEGSNYYEGRVAAGTGTGQFRSIVTVNARM